MFLLYSWRFSRYSASFHWLVHGHMTSNNETVSRQMPWAGNTAKAMTSNGKQFTVTRWTVHCWPLLHLMAGISARFSNFAFVLLYNKSLNDWFLGEQWILFPSNLNVSLDFVSGNIEILGKQNSLFPSGPVIKCLLLHDKLITQGEKRETSRKTWGFLCLVFRRLKIHAARTVLLSVLVWCSTFFSSKRQRHLSIPNDLSTTDLAARSFLLNSRSSGGKCPLFGYGLTSHFSSG